MALVQWHEDLSVGIELLDQDHRCLFSMLNELYDAVQYGTEATVITSLLDRLVLYTQDHFRHEEALMAECGYPDLINHRSEHNHLTAKVSELRQRLTDRSLESLSLELLVLFKTWLTSHIRISDFQYRPYLTAWLQSRNDEATSASLGLMSERLPNEPTSRLATRADSSLECPIGGWVAKGGA